MTTPEKTTPKDWVHVKARVDAVTKRKATYGQSEIELVEDNAAHHAFNEKYPLAYVFPDRYLTGGAKIPIGKKEYTVSHLLSHGVDVSDHRKTILVAKDPEEKPKVLKRMSPTEAVDFFLVAKELEENGIPVPQHVRLHRLDNPWIDTVEYDFIPGTTAEEYLHAATTPDVLDDRFSKLADYFTNEIRPLAEGKRLKNNRAYLPTDLGVSNILVSNADSDSPTFTLIDFGTSIQETPYNLDTIQDVRLNFMADIQKVKPGF